MHTPAARDPADPVEPDTRAPGPRMDRRQLECFLAIAEHRSFIGAARALHVAQPSLSQTIKAMERRVGGPLFRRTARGVLLTSAGESLLGAARQVLRSFETAEVAVHNVQDLSTGRLDVVALPALAADPMAEIIGRFVGEYPGIRVNISSPGSEDVVDLLQSGVHELGVTLGPCTASGLGGLEFEREPLQIAVAPGAGFRDGQAVSAEQLLQVGLVVNSHTRGMLVDRLAEAGAVARVTAETAHRDAIVPLVLHGLGAAILPPLAAQDARRRGAVVCIPGFPLYRQVNVLWRPGALTPAATALVRMLQRRAGGAQGRESCSDT